MPDQNIIHYFVLGGIAAAAIIVWYVLKIRVIQKKLVQAEGEAAAIRKSSEEDAVRLKKEKELEAKDDIFQWKVSAEKEIQAQRSKVAEMERGIAEKEQFLFLSGRKSRVDLYREPRIID